MVRIITDSGCDIPYGEDKRLGIEIMPFNLILDDKEYCERADFTPQEFYVMAEKSPVIPKTSQITITRFEEKFLECTRDGADDVICVLINGTGSATYRNAVQAVKNLTENNAAVKTRFHIIDSRSYSLGYGYPVMEAARKIRGNASVSSVIAYLTDWFRCVEIYIIGFDLRHMKKSGRISAASAFLGELMGLKPVISLIDGKSAVVKKSRGEKAAIEDAVSYISSRAIPQTPYQILRTTVTELENTFIKIYTKKVGARPALESYSGGVVTANAGTKFIGVVVRGNGRCQGQY